MPLAELRSLAQVLVGDRDFRDSRGRRHPLPPLLSLVFLGLLARICEMAVLQRWAETHWEQLQRAARTHPPRATSCHYDQPRFGPLFVGGFLSSISLVG